MTQLQPFYREVQAHYDVSDDFFALFLDPSKTYSCAYFERDDMTLQEAQMAKIDLALGKLNLKPGQVLLDIGCGWGATVCRAAERYGANVVGLTLSENQLHYTSARLAELPKDAAKAEVRLQGWEEFADPVDRIVSIGAFEHFRKQRYTEFFARCRGWLPSDGRMLLHTILMYDYATLKARNIPLVHEDVLFLKFIGTVIFPGGQLCDPDVVVDHAKSAGFRVEQMQSLQSHYVRTLECWAARLEAARDQAIAVTCQATYDTFMKYLTGCARYFGSGHIDVMQFTLAV